MKKKKLFLASLLSFSLTASMFFTTNIHALEEVQNPVFRSYHYIF
ncbi:hypothetical protein [Faecalibacillus intestinalis]